MDIALLEDSQSEADMIRNFLESSGHTCSTYNCGQMFMDNFPGKNHSILIIDWELPDTSGDQVLHWLRNEVSKELPVIFVTGRDASEDIVAMLEAGADDYMTKPIILNELLARITALVRRTGIHQQQEVIEVGPFTLDFNRHCISKSGERIGLTPKEFELAGQLLLNVGDLMPREKLLKDIWGYGPEINTRTIDIHISRIRKKLSLSEENGWRLTSIYHKGYRLEQVSLHK